MNKPTRPGICPKTAAALAARIIIAEVRRAPKRDETTGEPIFSGDPDSYLADCIIDNREDAWKKALAAVRGYGIQSTMRHSCCDAHDGYTGATCPGCKNNDCDPEFCGLLLADDEFDWDHFRKILDHDLDGLSSILMER